MYDKMIEILKKLDKKVVISCQASKGEPIYDDNALIPLIKSVINGGCAGLRLANKDIIKQTRHFTDIPIIGITKPEIMPHNWQEVVYITPTFKDAQEISGAGADIIAIDATSRPRPAENLEELISKIKKKLNKPVMADISTPEEGLNASKLGADIISTTLSGYTKETLNKNNGEPDFELLESLVNYAEKPVITEGRIWTPEQVRHAFKLGAFAVVIGSAVTRPQLITKRFVDST